jgi:hypothetical protein
MRRVTSQFVHLLAELLIGVLGLGVAAALLLAFRLREGPIDLAWAVTHFSGLLRIAGTQASLGSAQLAFEGFTGSDSPIDIRVRDLHLSMRGQGTDVVIPEVRVTFSLSQMLLLRLVPRSLEIAQAQLTVRRDSGGAMALALNAKSGGAASAGGDLSALLAVLAAPPRIGDVHWIAELRRVGIDDCDITLAAGNTVLRAPHGMVTLNRGGNGGVSGHADLPFSLGAATAKLVLDADIADQGIHVAASFGPLEPALLVPLTGVAAFGAIAAPLSVHADITSDLSFHHKHGRADISLGPGVIYAGTGSVAITSAYAALRGDETSLSIPALDILLKMVSAHPAPAVHASVNAVRAADGGYVVSGDIALDQVEFADLPAYWPVGTGGGARPWITGNISTGHAHDLHVSAGLKIPGDFSNLMLTGLGGTMLADDVTIGWLKPVPPVTDAAVKLTIDTPNSLHVDVLHGQQGNLAINEGRITIGGLAGHDQFADIDLALNGKIADTIALLSHPRLHLLSRSPVNFIRPSGDIAARLSVKLPLRAALTIDDVAISADATLKNMFLGDIAAHRDLSEGVAALHVTNAGLAVKGQGKFAAIPNNFTLKMDFTSGGPGQVVEAVEAEGTADPRSAVLAGLPKDILTSGTVPVAVRYLATRDAPGEVFISADMTPAEIKTPLGWTKGNGAAALGDMVMTVKNGALASVDRFSLHAADLTVEAATPAGGDPARLNVTQCDIGRTRAAGTLQVPGQDGAPWRLTARGKFLDLAPYFKQSSENAGTDADDIAAGPVYIADLTFDRADLAENQSVTHLRVHAENDGFRMQAATIFALGAGDISVVVAHTEQGRQVMIDAGDAGATLLGLNITSSIHGGTLNVRGVYDDRVMPPILAGTANLQNFRVLDAPAIGKLMQAMTLYGVSDLLSGPGLGFARMEAPFQYQGRKLTLHDARAFSSSLGITAAGKIDLRHKTLDIAGTLVPAYFFNQLLGNIPLIGQIFSPEKGGGVLAARYSLRGQLAEPVIGLNPLSALTPGALRNVFGIMD